MPKRSGLKEQAFELPTRWSTSLRICPVVLLAQAGAAAAAWSTGRRPHARVWEPVVWGRVSAEVAYLCPHLRAGYLTLSTRQCRSSKSACICCPVGQGKIRAKCRLTRKINGAQPWLGEAAGHERTAWEHGAPFAVCHHHVVHGMEEKQEQSGNIKAKKTIYIFL